MEDLESLRKVYEGMHEIENVVSYPSRLRTLAGALADDRHYPDGDDYSPDTKDTIDMLAVAGNFISAGREFLDVWSDYSSRELISEEIDTLERERKKLRSSFLGEVLDESQTLSGQMLGTIEGKGETIISDYTTGRISVKGTDLEYNDFLSAASDVDLGPPEKYLAIEIPLSFQDVFKRIRGKSLDGEGIVEDGMESAQDLIDIVKNNKYIDVNESNGTVTYERPGPHRYSTLFSIVEDDGTRSTHLVTRIYSSYFADVIGEILNPRSY